MQFVEISVVKSSGFWVQSYRALGSELVFGANMGLFPHLSRVRI